MIYAKFLFISLLSWALMFFVLFAIAFWMAAQPILMQP